MKKILNSNHAAIKYSPEEILLAKTLDIDIYFCTQAAQKEIGNIEVECIDTTGKNVFIPRVTTLRKMVKLMKEAVISAWGEDGYSALRRGDKKHIIPEINGFYEPKPHLVMVAGDKRSGKDTTSSLIQNNLEKTGYTCQMAWFAARMKEMIAHLFNTDLDMVEEMKNEEFKYEIKIKIPKEAGDHTTNMRAVLQRFGTEAMKSLAGDMVWAKDLQFRMKTLREENPMIEIFIVSDFRFPKEYEAMKEVFDNIITVKVIKNDIVDVVDAVFDSKTSSHVSETALAGFSFNVEVVNKHNGIDRLGVTIENDVMPSIYHSYMTSGKKQKISV